MSPPFSYRHLYYFWVVAKEGGFSRAAERLDMAVQTVSAQVRELERRLGAELLKPAGRGVTLTAAGQLALGQAEQIFQIGGQLPMLIKDQAQTLVVRLAVGISDGLSKLLVRDLMQPVLREPNLRLLCHEDEFEDLLGELALHRLDVVLADRPAPPNPNLKVYSHPLISPQVAWFAPRELHAAAARDFPRSLEHVPVLLPTGHVAVRPAIDRWCDQQSIKPRVVGEFEDSALLATFASGGMGVFPAPDLSDRAWTMKNGFKRIGACGTVRESVFAIGADRKVLHPLVRKLLARGR